MRTMVEAARLSAAPALGPHHRLRRRTHSPFRGGAGVTESWKVTLPCTRAEAEALQEDIAPLAALDPPPVLMTSEAAPDAPDRWRLDGYFESRPDPASIALLRSLVPSSAGAEPEVEQLEDEDWVTMRQAGL